MKKYIFKRILGMIWVMFIVLTLVFIIVRLAPGDPATLMLGPDATAQEAVELREDMGFNRPIIIQYADFISKVVQGDLGKSIFFNQPVLSILAERAEPSILLTLFSLGIAISIALPFGIASAYYRGTLLDQSSLTSAMLIASIPSFWTGLILQQYLGTELGWFPVSGYGGPGASFGERAYHLLLPSLVLGIVNSALILRFTRASMLDVLTEDYVRTARSKGLSEMNVVLRQAFKNTLIPLATVIGLTFALLISGAVVTERVFNLPGIGSLVVGSVLRRDYPMIQGTLIVVSGVYVLVNFLIDMIYLWIDPRVKY
ncbi:ABC transporter permease [Candidatus Thioglobus sp.]|jgi:peptide/nickel transport system permease protein|nr:ABC transporter permease [Candidatus Thioglobus sp.]MDA8981307.1 ABC transporter permease [Candidatus Thioglobus sp.]MDA9058436.1 ABC transporter permease [Candidatus Thioglobus sp.]MDB9933266.1 ABC transporter permease [Candidatus Thioglobus sp.]|tara:strand:+ start:496 stop:1437 length:942 start_codon:yes stop_codon:yes gene_type:complete